MFPDYILTVLNKLEDNGYEAYAVGGCVRDRVIGKEPTDYDIATNATPDQVRIVFSENCYSTVGMKHGTVGIIINCHIVEITTYRLEGKYTDRRHPDRVVFANSLETDLKRRDFTMNAMAMDKNGKIVDMFNGLKDIEKCVLRTVGEPADRFNEDALRILRCLRFASQFGFAPEKNTSIAVTNNKMLLKDISAERIRDEFVKIICGSYATEVLRNYRDVIEVFIPEIKPMYGFCQRTPFHKLDVWEHTIHAVGNGIPDPTIRTALFFHDISKPMCMTIDNNGIGHFKGHGELSAQMAEKILKRLKYSAKSISVIKTIIANHRYQYPNETEVKKMMRKTDADSFFKLLELKKADDSSKGYVDEECIRQIKNAEAIAERIVRNKECYRIKDLAIKGSDLMKFGLEGKQIGSELDRLLDLVIEGKVENNVTELEENTKNELKM